jgi:hypothetical protein
MPESSSCIYRLNSISEILVLQSTKHLIELKTIPGEGGRGKTLSEVNRETQSFRV